MLALLVTAAFFQNILAIPLLTLLFFFIIGYWDDRVFFNGMSIWVRAIILILLITSFVLAIVLSDYWIFLPSILLFFEFVLKCISTRIYNDWNQTLLFAMLASFLCAISHYLLTLPIFLWVPVVVIFLIIILINYKFYAFFTSKRGVFFAISVIPFHMLYYFYSAVSFALGGFIYFWGDILIPRVFNKANIPSRQFLDK
jgi:hypothetical protein